MRFKIIYADPPWHYFFGKTSSRYVDRKYNCMTKEELCSLPISSIAEDNSVLLLWITLPKLDWAFEIINAWGFTYKTNAFTWIKTNRKSGGLFWGMGYYTRSNAELCLLATKGDTLERVSHSVHSVIMSPVEEHSKKPDVARNKITELFGNIPRIELFGRQQHTGWVALGYDLDGLDIRQSLEMVALL